MSSTGLSKCCQTSLSGRFLLVLCVYGYTVKTVIYFKLVFSNVFLSFFQNNDKMVNLPNVLLVVFSTLTCYKARE